MTPRENALRAARFENPEYIPMLFAINASCWQAYPHDALLDLMEAHSFLFPHFNRSSWSAPMFGPDAMPGARSTDAWGCVWETAISGMVGAVVKHPLADWEQFDTYTPPDADNEYNWEAIGQRLDDAEATGHLREGGLQHGHTFLRVCDIHGYENVIIDMADEDPRLIKLLDMIESFNATVVRRYLDLGVDWMSYPEDLGMQVGPMVSPDLFRQFIKPSYQRLMAPAREDGCVVHMHSDGDIRDLVFDLIDGGVDVINLQDLVNGIDWIKENLAGKYAIDLDIDRQDITRFGTPAQIDALIREEVEKLGCKQGGLSMVFGLYPGAPLENIKALMDAMERYSGYYSG